MSDSHTAGSGTTSFTDTDWKEFHKSDIGAGAAVIVLMSGIFSMGLVLYTIIAMIVWS